MCATFVACTDCESCTRPISTNPASMEADEYGLTRGTCFITCRLEAVVVGGLLWLSWCVFGGADCFVFFFCCCFISSNATACCKFEAPFASLPFVLVMRQSRKSEATEAFFCISAKKPLHTGVRTGCHYLISLCACQCVCNIRRFY